MPYLTVLIAIAILFTIFQVFAMYNRGKKAMLKKLYKNGVIEEKIYFEELDKITR